MKCPQGNCEQVWMDIEDHLVPLLHLKPGERAIYAYLLRHTWLAGRRSVSVSPSALARGACICESTARGHLRSLVRKGCLKLMDRGQGGHALEVLLPEEILGGDAVAGGALPPESAAGPVRKNARLRRAIIGREGGRCFYCRRVLRAGEAVLDHVVPLARGGSAGEENIVASCCECNWRKGEQDAEDFLRALYRAGRLTASELDERVAALRAGRPAPRGDGGRRPEGGADAQDTKGSKDKPMMIFAK